MEETSSPYEDDGDNDNNNDEADGMMDIIIKVMLLMKIQS